MDNYIIKKNIDIDDCLCKYLKSSAKKHKKKDKKQIYVLPELTPDEILMKIIRNYNDIVEKYAVLYNNYMFLINNIKLLKKHIGKINEYDDIEELEELEELKNLDDNDLKKIKIETTNKIINENKIDLNIVKYLTIKDKIRLTDFISQRYNIYVKAINKLSQIISKLNKIFSKEKLEENISDEIKS
jgi:hypothetical protein